MDSNNKVDLNYLTIFNISHTVNDFLDKEIIKDIGYYIDYVLLKRSIIFNKILSEEKKRGRLINVYNRDDVLKELETEQLIDYIEECLKASELIFFNTELSLKNQSIFKEPIEMMSYYRKIRQKDEFKLSLEQKFTVSNFQFHEQISTFNYLYSTFDKISNIFETIAQSIKKEQNSDEYKENERVASKIIENAEWLSKATEERFFLIKWVESLQKSSIITLIRFKRNALSHDHSDVNDKYNLSIFINTLYIIILRLLTVIRRCVGNDDDLRERSK